MSHSLQDLLEGIYSSVLEARRFVNAQHLKLFESYFEKKSVYDPAQGKKITAYVPKLVPMATSTGVGAQERFEIFDVPALTLLPLSTLGIDTLEIEFEARIAGLTVHENADPVDGAEGGESPEPSETARAKDDTKDESADAGDDEEIGHTLRRTLDEFLGIAGHLEVMPKGESFESTTSLANIKVTFKIGDTPEGVAMIQEKMLDYLRK